jgi:hypothetical protein
VRARKPFIFVLLIILTSLCGCGRGIGIGGGGWDDAADVEEAKRYPTIKSDRISLATEEVPFGTFRQEFDTVFNDFPYSGKPVQNSKTQISGTPYSISHGNFTLKVFRDEAVIAERKLPRIFYMHPVSSGVIPGRARSDDTILCRTNSRATTGLHYVCILNGEGDILFEGILSASEVWDIAPGEGGEIIVGGARTKTVIARQD